jgi:hypothetical protein
VQFVGCCALLPAWHAVREWQQMRAVIMNCYGHNLHTSILRDLSIAAALGTLLQLHIGVCVLVAYCFARDRAILPSQMQAQPARRAY